MEMSLARPPAGLTRGPLRWGWAAVLATLLLAAPVAAGPVVVIGADGMTFDIVDPMVAAGRLPNIAALLDQGSRATLMSEKPMRSPALWTSIATGYPRDTHGIYDFVTGSRYWPRDQRSKDRRLVTSDMRRVPALWGEVGRQQGRSLVVGWLNTWPAEKLSGVMVAPYVALNERRQTSIKGRIYHNASQQTHPADLWPTLQPLVPTTRSVTPERVARIVDIPPAGSPLYRAVPNLQRYLYTVRWSVASTLANTRIIEKTLADRGPFDLVMTYFDGSDTLAHRFWIMRESKERLARRLAAHGLDPSLAPELKRRFGQALEGYYELVDEMVGRLRKAAGPGATMVILSDHGWGPSRGDRATNKTVPFDGEHRMEGIFVGAGPALAQGRSPRTLTHYDIAPTVLYLMGLEIPRKLPGRVATELMGRAHLVTHPPRRIEVKEEIARRLPQPSPGGAAPHEDKEIERLRSLGYVQ